MVNEDDVEELFLVRSKGKDRLSGQGRIRQSRKDQTGRDKYGQDNIARASATQKGMSYIQQRRTRRKVKHDTKGCDRPNFVERVAATGYNTCEDLCFFFSYFGVSDLLS